MSGRQGVSELLSERPDLEPALEEIQAIDQDGEPWTFDDIPLDSGTFGELVSRGVVEERGDGYRLADPDAVSAALADEQAGTPSEEKGEGEGRAITALSVSVPTVDRRVAVAFLGALVFVVGMRAYVFGSVFRGGDIVLSGNDPYYYRYWVEEILTTGQSVYDTSSGGVPGAVKKGEPFFIATLWWFTVLLGGTKTAAGLVLAWYPVIAAVIVAALTYVTAVAVTDDRRIGLAAVVLLAATPGHAFRTSLGYADHHAFDYVWLALTIYALVVLSKLSDPIRDAKAWGSAAVLAVGITAQTLAWEAGPLLVAPAGVYVVAKSLFDVHTGRAPLRTNAPLIAGIAVSAVLVQLAHTNLDWHTELVASAPVLLFAGTMAVMLTAALVSRLDLSVRVLAAAQVAVLPVGYVVAQSIRPEYITRFWSELTLLGSDRHIVETESLLSADTFGWLLLFGFVLVLAIPYLVWASVQTIRGRVRWLVLGVYTWYLLALAMIQIRFVGQLAPLAAIFAGIGFVHLAERVDLARRPAPLDATDHATDGGVRTFEIPTTQRAGALLALFVLIGGLGLVQTPVKISQITVDSETYQTASWINETATEQNITYPESYVFSRWGENRMYNYFVSGEARSYAYAQDRYESFAESTNEREWYTILTSKSRFIVTKDRQNPAAETLYARLHRQLGSKSGATPGVGHFQAIYSTPDRSQKVFRPVAGAMISLNASTSQPQPLTVQTTVSIPHTKFSYQRTTSVTDGRHQVRVAYPGKYTITGGRYNNTTVVITEAHIRNGTTVTDTVSQKP